MDSSDGDTSRADVRVGVAQRLIDSNGRYPEVQRLREHLVAAGIPAERVQVVGRDLTLAGPRSGRWTTIDAASRAALPGLIVGALVGWILRLTGLVTSDVAPGWVVFAAALIGAVIGAIVGVLGRGLVAGRRDAAQNFPMRVGRFGLLVDADVADQAARLAGGPADGTTAVNR